MQEELVRSAHARPPFWRDERVIGLISQIAVVLVIVGIVAFLYSNMISALRDQLGVPISFRWWNSTAGFDISESLIDYSRSDTYGRAFAVGLLNTLRVSILGIIFATVLGTVMGVLRLSTNYLVNRIAAVYIDTFRNIPLLVLLIFWAQAVFFQLPSVQDAIILPGPIYMSIRGVAIPWGIPTDSWDTYLLVLAAGVVLAILVAFIVVQIGRRTGRMPIVTLWVIGTFVLVALVGWFVLPTPLTWTRPELQGLNTTGGLVLSQQFMALLSGLVIYTSAFIAEIVRAGIQSVSKGQREASTALGLTHFQALRLIILPQALRVIIPPLTSQYLNLTKNSSLAVALGYPDLFSVAGNTIRNQTGRAIEVFLLVMLTYLAFSLITSLIMNVYNSRIQLVER